MALHVLECAAAFDVNSLIVWELLHHFRELDERLSVLSDSTVHQTLMEHGADEAAVTC
jgi:hypothetical protein